MSKNTSRKISDEQLERLAQTILRSVILTDEETEEIANSPQTWRKLQNNIARENTRREKKKGWIFFDRNRRARSLAFDALALLLFFGGAISLFRPPFAETAETPRAESPIPAPAETYAPPPSKSEIEPKPADASGFSTARAQKIFAGKSGNKRARNILSITSARPSFVAAQKSEKINKPDAKAATDFIALSYLPATESGQIVSVRVPRSMMVALGVTTNADRNAELVKAEVVLGDDGAARAIRFLKD